MLVDGAQRQWGENFDQTRGICLGAAHKIWASLAVA
jgi:hypothetical protein